MATATQIRMSDSRFSIHEMATHKRLTEDFVPANFTELHRHYWEYVLKLVKSAGIDAQNAEDVAQQLLTIFYEKDVLADFNPEFTSTHSGVVRKAVFRTFLSGFIRTYVQHYRTKQAKQHTREGVSIDVTVKEADELGEAATWMDLNGPTVVDDHQEMEYEILVGSVRDHLSTVAPRNAQDRCDMTELFDAIVEQLRDEDTINVALLAERFEVSKTSIQNWIKRLRSELTVVLEQ